MGRVKTIDQTVKRYDPALFAIQSGPLAPIEIYRKSKYADHPPHLIFALTDNWNITGKPREWGLTVIEARLRAMDLWKSETEVDRIEAAQFQREEAKERELKNNIESFLKDFRRQFARSVDSVNTGTLDKKIDRRRQYGA